MTIVSYSLFYILFFGCKQDWKTVNNFHVRVRRKNPVTGKFVSPFFFCLTYNKVKYTIVIG